MHSTKAYFILSVLVFFNLHALAQSISLDWVQTFGNNASDVGQRTLVDTQGNVYVLGQFSNTVDFDPSAAVFNLTSNGSADIFIQKLDANGNFLWAKSLGGVGLENVHDAALDANGNLLFCGSFLTTMDINPGLAVDIRTSNGLGDMYMVKLDASGNFIWGHTFGGIDYDMAMGIMPCPNGEVLFTANYFTNVDVDPGPAVLNISAPQGGVCILKLSAAGNFLWEKHIQGIGSGHLSVYDNALDMNQNILIIGNFNDTIDVDPGPGSFLLTPPLGANNNGGIYILKLDSLGNFIWVKALGSTNYINANAVVINASNELYIGGDFDDSVDMDPGPFVNLQFSNTAAAYILKLDASGNFLWTKIMGGVNSGGGYPDAIHSLDVDNQGNIAACGTLSGAEDFDPNAGVLMLTSNGHMDCFVMKLDSSGQLVYAKSFGGFSSEKAYDLFVNAQGEVLVTGHFNVSWPTPEVDFDPNAGVVSKTSAGGPDLFILKFKDCHPTNAVDTIHSCTPITWIDGNTYSANNNTAWYTLANVQGCDSLVNLQLTITVIDTTLSVSADTLSSNTANANYQWLDCEHNLMPISGATSQTFVPTSSGIFAVAITLNTCTDTSACTNFVATVVNDFNASSDLLLYPNPASDFLHLKSFTRGEFKLFNQLGQEVFYQLITQKETKMNISFLPDGLYNYQFLQNGEIVHRAKVLIHK